jgi:hypothetical protein
MATKSPSAFGNENRPVEIATTAKRSLALEDNQDSARQPELAGDRQRRHHVGRRDNGAEQEADVPRQSDQIMRRGGDREGGEDHAADRQKDDGAQIVLEFAPAHGDAGRIDQRRQYHQQHQFRRQFQRRHSRHEGEHGAGQQQQDRRRDIDPPCQQRRARQHRQQNQEYLEFGFHGPSKSSAPPLARKAGKVNAAERQAASVPLLAQIVAVGFRDDLPAVGKFHRHQIVGEVARRQLAADLDKGGGIVGAVDGDDEILARLSFRLCGWSLPYQIQPIGQAQDFQLALFLRAQVGGRVEDRAELVGIAVVQAVEIVLDDGFNGGTVVTHRVFSYSSFRVRALRAAPE